jgi:DNA-binding CsgD family transcriptional regulator
MLTKREEQVLELIAYGFSADEIADKFFRSTETIKKTVSNVKEKLSLQKATELAAFYWCRAFGDNFKQRRNAILSISLLIVFLFSNPLENQTARRNSTRTRVRIERRYKTKK